jgi:3-dehydroquinate dehydratase-2
MNILVLNGPNLNLLGEREPQIYGTETLDEIIYRLTSLATANKVTLRCIQSNHEGVLIDAIQDQRTWLDAMIFNPGALTHYAYSLRDTVAAVNKPMIEVHLSDPMQREAFRHTSVFDGMPMVERILGQGAKGYEQALFRLVEQLVPGPKSSTSL